MSYEEPPTAPGACCDTAPCTCQQPLWTEEEIREAVKTAALTRRYGGTSVGPPLTATREEAAAWRAAQLADRVMEELMRDGS